MVYTYAAEMWCEDCGRAIAKKLAKEGKAPRDPSVETSYDSGAFPKVFYGEVISDVPQHCASGEDCPNGEWLGADYVGELLTDSLTPEGVEYVRDSIRSADTELTRFWALEFDVPVPLDTVLRTLRDGYRAETFLRGNKERMRIVESFLDIACHNETDMREFERDTDKFFELDHEIADSLTEVYNGELMEWYHNEPDTVDEAFSEGIEEGLISLEGVSSIAEIIRQARFVYLVQLVCEVAYAVEREFDR